jgi:hypothetical protein
MFAGSKPFSVTLISRRLTSGPELSAPAPLQAGWKASVNAKRAAGTRADAVGRRGVDMRDLLRGREI